MSVKLIEAAEEVGGGLRSAELTLPGFVHDVCASVLPLGLASPFLDGLPLAEHGVRWVQPELCLAHAIDGGEAVVLARDLAATAAGLGVDGRAYRRLVGPLVDAKAALIDTFLGPLKLPTSPRTALAAGRFGVPALTGARLLATASFRGERARALFAGLAAHAIQPLERPATAAFALMLALLAHEPVLAHEPDLAYESDQPGIDHAPVPRGGWPFVAGGTGRLAAAMAAYFASLGGEIETSRRVTDLGELSDSRYVLLDLAPRDVLRVMGQRLGRHDRASIRYRRGLERYRHGPGVFKLDLALSGPVPWTAEACRQAGTVHLGGTLEEVAAAERLVWQGVHPERPFVLVAQPSLLDRSRAPEGGAERAHTLWAYCHVPNGSDVDQTAQVLDQLERFAPGVRDLVLATHARTAAAYEVYDPNFVGGDINCGVQDLGQLFTRPAARLDPYSTPDQRTFVCSSATPPGGGVHGLCGVGAARSLLRRLDLGSRAEVRA